VGRVLVLKVLPPNLGRVFVDADPIVKAATEGWRILSEVEGIAT
jgi:hypothetical protein